jgi:hypothetical protein
MGLSSNLPRPMAPVIRLRDDRRGARHWAHLFAPQTSHEGGAVKARACRYRRGNLEGKAYCLIGEGFRNSSVASSIGLPLLTGAPAEPQLVFCFINQSLLRLALWSCGRRVSVVQAQRQIHRVLAGRLHLAVSMARAHLFDCGFRCPQNLTSGRRSQSGWHHNPSFWRSSGSEGRVHTV